MAFRKMPKPRIALGQEAWLSLAVLLMCVLVLTGCGAKATSNLSTGGGGGTGGGGTGGGGGGAAVSSFFGMHINFSTTAWPNVPVAGLRMWDDHAAWSLINTAPGVYDWTLMDTWLAEAQTNKADVLYDLARTPSWAQCPNTDATCGSANATIACSYSTTAGEGGAGQCFPPNDLNVDGTGANQHWIDWVTAVATHSVASSTAHIKYYEIWNEPDSDPQWQGTNAQLVRMAQDARCILLGTNCNSLSTYSKTGIDTSAILLTPAFTSSTKSDVTTAMQSYLSAGGSQYADVVAFHGYLGPNPPEQIATLYTNFSTMLAGLSLQSKPVFNTEASWGVNNPITDPDMQAAWVGRYVLLQIGAGISRFYWYSWDVPGVTLVSSGTLTPAGVAFAQMNQWTSGATTSGACTAQGSVWTCGLTRANGYQAAAVWDTTQTCSNGSCTTVNYSAPSQFTQYIDLAGKTVAISGGTVPVGIKPILLETGNIP